MADLDKAKAIGKRIGKALESSGIDQGSLGSAVGVDRTTVNHWVTGRHSPRTAQLADIANFLGVSTDYLLGLEKEDWFYRLSPEIREFIRKEVSNGRPVYLKAAQSAKAGGLSAEAIETITQALRKNITVEEVK